MKGIIFSDPMARANAEGRKTMTRRLGGLETVNLNPGAWRFVGMQSPTVWVFEGAGGWRLTKPKFQPGEVFYQKERFALHRDFDDMPASKIASGAGCEFTGSIIRLGASPERGSLVRRGRWRSPLFLPAIHARFFARVTEVRAERLQSISEEDARREGVMPKVDTGIAVELVRQTNPAEAPNWQLHRMEFWALWRSIHGPASWDTNPWVWVIGYTPISREEAQAAK